MKQFFFIMLFFGYLSATAQVGIGNTDPKSALDISASNTATPSNTDGILIPRIDNFPSSNPAADQDGMLVFVTGNGTPTKGFYFWNNTTTSWINVSGAKEINDLIDGHTDSSGFSVYLGMNSGINDDGSNNINTGLGFEALFSTTSGNSNTGMGWHSLYSNTIGSSNTAIGNLSMSGNTDGSNNTAIGRNALLANSTGDNNTAIGSFAMYLGANTSNNTIVGAYAYTNNTTGSNNTILGFEAGHVLNGSGNVIIGHQAAQAANTINNSLFIENTDADENNALIYGEFGTDNSSTGNILRTNGQFQIGNPSLTGYAFPLTDGTNGQILTTDGTGNMSFQNPIISSDWYEAGTTANPNAITDDIFTQGNVGIGNTTPSAALDISYSGTQANGINLDFSHANAGSGGYGLNINAQSADSGGIAGLAITVQNSNSSSHTIGSGIINTANGSNNEGLSSQVSGNGNNNIAISGMASGASDENIGGSFVASSPGIINTGISARATGATFNWAGFFGVVGSNGSGNVYVNDLLEVASAFRYTDGNEAAGFVLRTNANGDATWADPNTIFSDTQNTLDQAYDEGGAGAGRVITATDGALRIAGEDGFEITGTFGTGDDLSLSGGGTRLFFNPKKAAFRAGNVTGNQWNLTNIGNYSFAAGNGTYARGEAAFAGGFSTAANGRYSAAFGTFAEAFSYAEMAIGSYPTEYTPANPNGFNITDRAFVIGNSNLSIARSNAFEIWKDGRVIINESYTLPTTDGTTNQVLTTDGSGNVSWQDGASNTLALTRITMSANQNFPAFSDEVKINFDTVDFDLNSNFNTSTDRFIASTAGYYRISGQYTGSTSSSPSVFSFDIAVNGIYIRRHISDDIPNGAINSVVYLNVNDFVEMKFSSTTSSTIFSNSQITYFEIEQIR